MKRKITQIGRLFVAASAHRRGQMRQKLQR